MHEVKRESEPIEQILKVRRVPVVYYILEDLKDLAGRLFAGEEPEGAAQEA